MKTDKKGTCVYKKDIHVSQKGQGAATNKEKGQGAATNKEKGQGFTRTRAGAAPCKNGLARTLATNTTNTWPLSIAGVHT
jgi:hypothetical protein